MKVCESTSVRYSRTTAAAFERDGSTCILIGVKTCLRVPRWIKECDVRSPFSDLGTRRNECPRGFSKSSPLLLPCLRRKMQWILSLTDLSRILSFVVEVEGFLLRSNWGMPWFGWYFPLYYWLFLKHPFNCPSSARLLYLRCEAEQR